MDFNNIQLYKNKTMADVFKEIHDSAKDKETKIQKLIQNLEEQITTAGDAAVLVPLISKYIDNSTKNQDNLIKMLGVAQRLLQKSQSDDDSPELTDDERSQLISDIKQLKKA